MPFVVYVNGKYSDEYLNKENADAHAEMAKRLGNTAEVKYLDKNFSKLKYNLFTIFLITLFLILLGKIQDHDEKVILDLQNKVATERFAPKVCVFKINKDVSTWPCTMMTEKYYYAHG